MIGLIIQFYAVIMAIITDHQIRGILILLLIASWIVAGVGKQVNDSLQTYGPSPSGCEQTLAFWVGLSLVIHILMAIASTWCFFL